MEKQERTIITKFFDAIDSIDRKLFGRRMQLFIWGCILVLVAAPLLDKILNYDRITYFSTLMFFVFIVALILTFICSWRDDTGNWSFARAKSRLKTYCQILIDMMQMIKTNSKDENLFKLGQTLFFVGIAWKSFQNISVFIRKPLEELLSERLFSMRKFEVFTIHWFWIPILIGFAIIIYLYWKNPQISIRIKNELRQLFGWRTNDKVKIEIKSDNELIINANVEQQINSIKLASNSSLFNDFITALQKWKPRRSNYEYEYQERLYRYLRRNLRKNFPDVEIITEYPIINESSKIKRRLDIVINDTILIEMKRDSSTSAVDRARTQISDYSEIWNNRGPVILLLCDYEYEKAKIQYSSTMANLVKENRPVITIVANQR